MRKARNFGEERLKVLNKFMFLAENSEQQSQVKVSINNPIMPTQERSLETMRMLASGPTKINQPLNRSYDVFDEEEELGAVMPMAEFAQLPDSVSNNEKNGAGLSPHYKDLETAKDIKQKI